MPFCFEEGEDKKQKSKMWKKCRQNHVKLELNEREWTCLECKVNYKRDYYAAINIKKEGLRLLKV